MPTLLELANWNSLAGVIVLPTLVRRYQNGIEDALPEATVETLSLLGSEVATLGPKAVALPAYARLELPCVHEKLVLV
jgi:hypothetical protein